MSHRTMSEIVRRQQPVTLPATATVQEACRLMHEKRIGAILILDAEGRLAGVLTGRDVVGRVAAPGRDPCSTSLAEVMTHRPDTISPKAPAIEALRIMSDGGYRHLPVVEGAALLGIVSRGDFRGLELARHDEETGYWEIM